MEIRKAGPEDIEIVLELSTLMFNFHVDLDKYYGLYSDYEDHRDFYKEQLASESVGFFLAEKDGEAVGLLSGSITSIPGTDAPKIAKIISLFVREESRGQKVGTLLYDTILSWFKSQDVKHVEVSTDHSNMIAIDFWKQCKFKDYQVQLRLDID